MTFLILTRRQRKYTGHIKITTIKTLSHIFALGGYYKFSKYKLNLQTENRKNNYIEEIKAVIDLLDEKANAELRLIMDVDIHHSDDGYYCRGNDLLVFQGPPYWEQ